MEQSLKSKGFAVSPFFLIGLILIGLTLSVYFIQVRESSTDSIGMEGSVNKAILDVEKPKATIQSVTLLSAYQSAYEAGQDGKDGGMDENRIKTKLKGDLITDLNLFKDSLDGEFDISDDVFEFSDVTITPNVDDKNEGFLIKVKPKPTVTRKGDNLVVSSEMGVEKFVGARIFLLEELSGDLEREFKEDLAPLIRCTLSGVSSCDIIGNRIKCSGDLPDQREIPEDFMRKENEVQEKIHESLLELESKVANENALTYLTDENVTLKFEIDKISAKIDRYVDSYREHCCPGARDEETGECTEWDWDYDVDLDITGKIEINAYLVDYATLYEYQEGKFEVCTEAPVTLKNGKVEPLEYYHKFTVNYEVHIDYISDCEPKQVVSSSDLTNPSLPSYRDNTDSLRYDGNFGGCIGGSIYEGIDCSDTDNCVDDCGGDCTVTDSCAEERCYEGDVWCYDNCGDPDHLKESCPEGCEDGRCMEEEFTSGSLDMKISGTHGALDDKIVETLGGTKLGDLNYKTAGKQIWVTVCSLDSIPDGVRVRIEDSDRDGNLDDFDILGVRVLEIRENLDVNVHLGDSNPVEEFSFG